MFTFAYGGNLDVTRMRKIAPDIRFISRAYYSDHTIGFPIMHEGIPQIAAVPQEGSWLWGVVYEIPDGPEVELLTGLRESSAEKVDPVAAAYYGR